MRRILHLGAKELDLNKIVNVTGTNLNKPSFGSGSLYGSTLIKLPGGRVNSSWKEYVSNDYTSKDCNFGVSFTLNKKSKILEIANLDDYLNIMQKYKIEEYANRGEYSLDFAKISKEYDAFHLTEDAFYSMRLPFGDEPEAILYDLKYDDFYAYDAETWIIFNLNAINKGSILNHNNVCDILYMLHNQEDEYDE